jgi:hypothetical protein
VLEGLEMAQILLVFVNLNNCPRFLLHKKLPSDPSPEIAHGECIQCTTVVSPRPFYTVQVGSSSELVRGGFGYFFIV